MQIVNLLRTHLHKMFFSVEHVNTSHKFGIYDLNNDLCGTAPDGVYRTLDKRSMHGDIQYDYKEAFGTSNEIAMLLLW